MRSQLFWYSVVILFLWLKTVSCYNSFQDAFHPNGGGFGNEINPINNYKLGNSVPLIFALNEGWVKKIITSLKNLDL